MSAMIVSLPQTHCDHNEATGQWCHADAFANGDIALQKQVCMDAGGTPADGDCVHTGSAGGCAQAYNSVVSVDLQTERWDYSSSFWELVAFCDDDHLVLFSSVQ